MNVDTMTFLIIFGGVALVDLGLLILVRWAMKDIR
jgi:hypothetical protein